MSQLAGPLVLGLPKSVFDDLQAQLAANRAKFYYDVPARPFYGFNRPGVKTIEPVVWNGGARASIRSVARRLRALSRDC